MALSRLCGGAALDSQDARSRLIAGNPMYTFYSLRCRLDGEGRPTGQYNFHCQLSGHEHDLVVKASKGSDNVSSLLSKKR